MYMCHWHFQAMRNKTRDEREAVRAAAEQCLACYAAQQEGMAKIKASERKIDPDQPWGEHIALTCTEHPDLRWSTKNIDFIGARSLFYKGTESDGYGFPSVPECACSIRLLVPVKEA